MVFNMEKQWLIDFGARLRHEREKRGLSQSALAKLAHTDAGYIVQIESGRKSPSLRLLINLFEALGSSADYIIFGSVAEKGEEAENTLQKFVNFLRKKTEQEIIALYKMVRAIDMYRKME